MILSPLPKLAFLDNNGRPLVGGQLFTYEAGTSTKIATYTDEGGLTQNANPVVLDFRGEANVWLDPELTYKFILAPRGDTDPPTKPIWSVDDIAAPFSILNLTQTLIGSILYPQTQPEEDADINPAAPLIYVYGDPRRDATYRSSGWVNFGDVPAKLGASTVAIPGDVTARYSRGRRVQIIGTGGLTNESRILNATFAAGVTTLDLINDVSGNGGLVGSVPDGPSIISLGVGGDLNTTNAWVQDSNAIVSQNFINKNVGDAAGSRVIIANYASDSGGGATSDTSGVAIVITGGAYASPYLPGMPPGRNVIMHTGLDIPLWFGTWDTARLFIPSENGTYAQPIVFFGTVKTVLNAEGIRLTAPSEPGNAYQAWYRSDETTRKGFFGFDSAGVNNNITLKNEETGTARIILQTVTSDITLASATDIQLALAGAGGTGFIKISPMLGNFANDAAAAAGGVPVSGLYRNGSIVMIRVV